MELAALECDDEELLVRARSRKLGLLPLNFHSEGVFGSWTPACLICLRDLVISGLNQVASPALAGVHAPHPYHEIRVDRVQHELHGVEEGADQLGVLAGQDASVLLLGQRNRTLDAVLVVGCLKVLADAKALVLGHLLSERPAVFAPDGHPTLLGSQAQVRALSLDGFLGVKP